MRSAEPAEEVKEVKDAKEVKEKDAKEVKEVKETKEPKKAPLLENDLTAPKQKPPEKKKETKPAPKKQDPTLTDEVVTQIAQAKYEAQEDKLKDVARHSMALIRDFNKMDEQDFFRKIADIQRCLVKYEMQYIRAWEIEEKRRQREIADLEAMRSRFQKEGEAEEKQLEGQREVLQKAQVKRKRYEGYEALAASVNTKRPQHDSKELIHKLTLELQKMSQQQKRFNEMSQLRDERSRVLAKAVEELDKDFLAEQEFREENFGPDETEAIDNGNGIVCEQPNGELVELVS
ncbi:unnamed protein product [Cladocopium goreaui]|uniref:Uncharacterized protein n=1 Tax=Cladocopium goreaui TaxID=2562237 RepID=A0A9P1BW06_9DINO|nr:unnamed protein product [Cladocopium goreaui]